MNVTAVNNKKTIRAWAFFDWANSAYSLIITVAIFPLYFNAVVEDEFVLWGMHLTDTNAFSYSISFAYIIIALFLPILGGIADHSGRRMTFMRRFTILGAVACISLFFFKDHSLVALGMISFMLATIGFAGGQAFNNAFLPIIATADQYDRVSAKGFAYGFVGSVILLIIILVCIQAWEAFGFVSQEMATRSAFVMVGVWWLSFSQITFRRMPKEEKLALDPHLIFKGYKELKTVWSSLRQDKNIVGFLLAFFFYSAGTQTLLFLASTFAADELNFGGTEMILLILLLQILAIGGAYLFSYVSKVMGNKISIILMLLIWIAICIFAYYTYSKVGFYIIASFVGLVMGGIQSVSRATYSKLIPRSATEIASYFSFYDLLEKVAIVLGTFSFGLIETMTGGMRNSILALICFFIIGMVILSTTKIEERTA